VTVDPESFDGALLEIVVCPRCHAHLQPMPAVGEPEQLVCSNDECGLRYPVRDGVPILLIDEATRGD
jgi:uncharacterized protein YbaR (Trm112 family)